MIGWYSKAAAEKCGSSYYNTPNGSIVEVTLASPDPDTKYNWPDKVCVGPITTYYGPCVMRNTAIIERSGKYIADQLQ